MLTLSEVSPVQVEAQLAAESRRAAQAVQQQLAEFGSSWDAVAGLGAAAIRVSGFKNTRRLPVLEQLNGLYSLAEEAHQGWIHAESPHAMHFYYSRECHPSLFLSHVEAQIWQLTTPHSAQAADQPCSPF
eukprot:COSAG05_NODE_268_length_12518_cov_6.452774_10_plen_130_part_00